MRFSTLSVVTIALAPVVLGAATPGPVVTAASAPTHAILDGKGRATLLLHEGVGSKEASLTILVLDAGAAVPEHVHDTSAEILYVEQGSVQMVVDGKPVTASAGDAIRIPAGVKHSAKVTSKEAMRAVQVYVGPGPEQRFTKGPPVK